jgi:hypothetical protein
LSLQILFQYGSRNIVKYIGTEIGLKNIIDELKQDLNLVEGDLVLQKYDSDWSEWIDNDNESTQSGNICSQPLDRKAFCGTSLSEPTALMEVVPDDEKNHQCKCRHDRYLQNYTGGWFF